MMERLSWTILLVLSMAGIAAFFPVAKYLDGAVDPFLLSFFRFAFAALALAPIILHRRSFHAPSKKHFGIFAAIGLTMVFPTALVVTAIPLTNTITSAILMNTQPIMIALLAPFVVGELVTTRKLLGLCVGFVGVVLVVLNGQNPLEHVESLYFWGSCMLLIAALFAAFSKMFSRDLVRAYDGLFVTFFGVALGTFFLALVVGAKGGFADVVSFTPEIWLSLLSIGVVSTGIPWFIWNSSLKHLDVHVAISFNLLIPIFAALYSLLLFSESLTPWILFGLALTSASVYFVQNEARRPTPTV